jgi:GTP cyclohydrolase I
MQTDSPHRQIMSDKGNEYLTNGHTLTIETPVKLTDEAKIKLVSEHLREIMKIMGLDVNKEGLRETPNRVARMYIKEMFKGLNPANKPSVTFYENKHKYNKVLVEKNIAIYSFCEHHFLPVIGKAHVAYIPNGRIIGLSKLNRIVHYCSAKPQSQEGLTEEIAHSLKDVLGTQDVAVLIDAVHHCITERGVRDSNSSTVTSHFGGRFQNEDIKMEFLFAVK